MRPHWIIATVLFTTSVASASEKHTHDGFYLRLQAGGGYTSATTTEDDYSIKGASGGLNVEIGGALTRNLILYGKLFGTSTPSPKFKQGDISFESDEDTSSNFATVGLGLTYYLMPANVYLSGAVSATQIRLTYEDEEFAKTDAGIGLHLGIGKEWWVGDEWGIGIGAEVALSRIPDDAYDWNVGSALLVFTATYN